MCSHKIKESEGFICYNCSQSVVKQIKFHPLNRDGILVEWLSLSAFMDYHIVKKKWDLLSEIKFENKKRILIFLLNQIPPIKLPYKADFVTYIPISFKRFIERGFNPSKIIAKKIADDLKIPCISTLKKSDDKKQSNKTRTERLKVLERSPFKLKKSCNFINEKSLIIVDDIITTGATIGAANLTIKEKYKIDLQGIGLFFSDI